MSLRHDNKQAGERDHCVCVWTGDGYVSPLPTEDIGDLAECD